MRQGLLLAGSSDSGDRKDSSSALEMRSRIRVLLIESLPVRWRFKSGIVTDLVDVHAHTHARMRARTHTHTQARTHAHTHTHN